jgi:heme A synthase
MAGYPYAWFPVELAEPASFSAWLQEGVRVQWLHRLVGVSVWVGLFLGAKAWKGYWTALALLLGTVQIGLGILVVISGVSIPIAIAHQVTAALIWVVLVRIWDETRGGRSGRH